MGFLGPTWYQGDAELPAGTLAHYTDRHALARIMQAGVIRPYRALPDDAVPLVWLSTNGIWEPASGRATPWNPAQPLGFDQLCAINGGLARLLVDADVAELAWKQLRQLVSPGWVRAAEQPSQSWFKANCHRWYASRHAIGRDHWLGIEVWRAPRWTPLPYTWEEG